MPVTIAELIQVAFYGLISIVAVYLANVLGKLKESVDVLNVSIAVVIEKIANHEKRLDRHDVDIKDLKHTQTKDN
jgi:hypothetical protein